MELSQMEQTVTSEIILMWFVCTKQEENQTKGVICDFFASPAHVLLPLCKSLKVLKFRLKDNVQ